MDRIAHCCLIDGGYGPSVKRLLWKKYDSLVQMKRQGVFYLILINNNQQSVRSKM
jgi:hypothetical protein